MILSDKAKMDAAFEKVCPGGMPNGYYRKVFDAGVAAGKERHAIRCGDCGEDLSHISASGPSHRCQP